MSFYAFLSGFLLFLFIIFSQKENQTYGKISKKYKSKFKILIKNSDRQMLYFWLDEWTFKKDYISGMFVYSGVEGVYIKPTIVYWRTKSVFIPWEDLELVGEMTRYFQKKSIYKIANLNMHIAFKNVDIIKN